jgi:hypothetical protein
MQTETTANIWAWLLEGAEVASKAAVAPVDLDLDFLEATEPEEAGTLPLPALARTHERWRAAEQLWQEIASLPEDWERVRLDPRWPGVDAAAAWLLARWLQQAPDAAVARGTAHGPLAQLLQRAVRCVDADVAVEAAKAMAHLGISEGQEDLSLRLMEPESLNHTQLSALLDVLDLLGDGRCVRAMEAVLAAKGGELPEHHAWRARHIVQRIRRGGRR